ncbi:hypothetical protein DYH09_16385 [bacterium CPR1]|nr:hypothetical protein [bacterium CPR1]
MNRIQPIRVLRALLLTVLVMVTLMGLLLTFVPNLREELIGHTLRHRLKAGEEGDVALTMVLTRGQEIVGEARPSDQLRGEQLQINIRLYESVESTGREESIRYEVREMRSEQLSAGIRGVLGKERFTLRIPARGGLVSVLRSGASKQDVLADSNLGQFSLLLWPTLPDQRITAKDARWSDKIILSRKLLTEELRLVHKLDFKLIRMEERQGKDYALIEFSGYIDPEMVTGEMKPAGQGKVVGRSMIDMATGRAVLGAYDLRQDYLLELKGARYRWFEHQDLKFYRGKTPDELEAELLSSPSPSP